jgi:hypothetical protein
MTQSTKILAAALIGAIVTVAGMAVASFGASAATGNANFDIVAERIGGAFATIEDIDFEPTLETALEESSKGDLEVRSDCAGETWPNIAPECLVTADGSDAPRVRYVTVDYQSDETTTVLMRIPASEAASY